MTIVIDATHNGPAESGHGGVSAGRMAELIDPRRAVVRLHTPVPLDTPMVAIRRQGEAIDVGVGATVVATVRPLGRGGNGIDLSVFPRVSSALVGEAERRWLDARGGVHPFPTCFGCGPERPRRDGLELRPGRVDSLGVHATQWTPGGVGETPAWLVWAALDCASGGPAMAAAPSGASVLTGELAVEIREPVEAGSPHLLVSREALRSGRTVRTEAALLDATGRALAAAAGIWFMIERTGAG
jgi:hypothetical protein